MHNNVNYSIGTYSTERCILRPINLNDSLDMFEYYSKDYVVKYLPIKHHKSISDTKRFINSNQQKGKVEYADSDLPRSFVLADGEGTVKIRLSRISTVGLKQRAEGDYSEI